MPPTPSNSNPTRAAQLQLRLGARALETGAYARVRSVLVDQALDAAVRIEARFDDEAGAFSALRRLDPGTALEVRLDWGGTGGQTPLARGKITAVGNTFSEEGTTLRIVAHGPRHALQHGTLSAAFEKSSAGELMSRAGQKHRVQTRTRRARLRPPHNLVAATPVARLLEEQAARAGLVILEDRDTLEVAPLTLTGAAVPLSFGTELLDFRAEANLFEQVTRVAVYGVDPMNKKAIKGEARDRHAFGLVGRDVSGAVAAKKAFGETVLEVGDCPVRSRDEAQALAEALFNDRLFRFVTATGQAVGAPALRAGGLADIQGMGARLSGTWLLTRVTHRYTSADGFSSSFEACRPALGRAI